MNRQPPNTPYSQVSRLNFRVGGEFIDITSKPGWSNWNQLSPAAYLIAEKVILPSDSRVLYLGCGNGAAGLIIAKQLTTGHLWLHDISYIAAQMTAETFSINQKANAHVLTSINLPAELDNNLDAVIIELPKGRKLAQRWLAHAFKLLKTGIPHLTYWIYYTSFEVNRALKHTKSFSLFFLYRD